LEPYYGELNNLDDVYEFLFRNMCESFLEHNNSEIKQRKNSEDADPD